MSNWSEMKKQTDFYWNYINEQQAVKFFLKPEVFLNGSTFCNPLHYSRQISQTELQSIPQ